MTGGFEVGLLGPFEVRLHGVRVELPQGRSRTLLAVLALEAGRPVAIERLIDELWGTTPPATAVTAVHGLVSGLRKRIEPDRSEAGAFRLLVTRPRGYVLEISPDQVDAHRFRMLVGQAAGVSPGRQAELLRAAVGLWRGAALADLEFAGTASSEAVALEEMRSAAYEDLFDAELALGSHHDLISEIERMLSAHPLRERLYGQLMLAHYRSGRQSDALEVWHRARAILADQIGVEPGPGLRRLHRAILEQDPAVDVPTGVVAGADVDVGARGSTTGAGELLAVAATSVFDRHYDADTAQQLLSRAERLLPVQHPQRHDVAARISEFYLMLGRPTEADERLKLSLVEARTQGDPKRELSLHLERARIQLIAGPDPIPLSEITSLAARALDGARRTGDDVLISQACYVLGLIEWRWGRIVEMERLFRDAFDAAERGGTQRERLASRWLLALALAEGPTPVPDAIAECEELAELNTAAHLGVLTELARLHALRDENDAAQRYIAHAREELQRRPGMRRPAMFVEQRTAELARMTGDPRAGEPHLREALALANALGEADQRSQLAAKLSLVLTGRGSWEEANELAHRSRWTAPAESIRAQALWRLAMAAVKAASGDHQGGQLLVEQATALVPDDMRLLTTEVRTELSHLRAIS